MNNFIFTNSLQAKFDSLQAKNESCHTALVAVSPMRCRNKYGKTEISKQVRNDSGQVRNDKEVNVMPCLTRHPLINDEIPKQVRNDNRQVRYDNNAQNGKSQNAVTSLISISSPPNKNCAKFFNNFHPSFFCPTL